MGVVMEDESYAIVGPDNKAINFVLWDGVTYFDYGQDNGNYMVPLAGISPYGFGWIYDSETNTFIDPTPPPE